MQNWTFQGSKNEILAEPGQDGFGVYRWASDNYYLGEWKDGKFNGLGVRRFENENSRFAFFEDDDDTFPYFYLAKGKRKLEIGLVKDESTGVERCLILFLDTGDWEYAQFDKNGERFGSSFNFDANTRRITIEQYENGSNNQYYTKKVLPIDLRHVDNKPLCEGCQMSLSEIKNLNDFVYATGTDKNGNPFQRVRNSSSMSFGVGITHWPSNKEFQIGQFFGASKDGWYLQKQICSKYEKISFRYCNDTGGLFCLSLWKGLIYLFNEKHTAFFQYEKGYLTFGDRSKTDHYDIEGLGIRMDLSNGVIEECIFEKGAVKEVKQALFIEGEKLYKGNKRNKVNPETGYSNYLTKHPNYLKEDWHANTSSTSSSSSYSSSTSSSSSSGGKQFGAGGFHAVELKARDLASSYYYRREMNDLVFWPEFCGEDINEVSRANRFSSPASVLEIDGGFYYRSSRYGAHGDWWESTVFNIYVKNRKNVEIRMFFDDFTMLIDAGRVRMEVDDEGEGYFSVDRLVNGKTTPVRVIKFYIPFSAVPSDLGGTIENWDQALEMIKISAYYGYHPIFKEILGKISDPEPTSDNRGENIDNLVRELASYLI